VTGIILYHTEIYLPTLPSYSSGGAFILRAYLKSPGFKIHKIHPGVFVSFAASSKLLSFVMLLLCSFIRFEFCCSRLAPFFRSRLLRLWPRSFSSMLPSFRFSLFAAAVLPTASKIFGLFNT